MPTSSRSGRTAVAGIFTVLISWPLAASVASRTLGAKSAVVAVGLGRKEGTGLGVSDTPDARAVTVCKPSPCTTKGIGATAVEEIKGTATAQPAVGRAGGVSVLAVARPVSADSSNPRYEAVVA